MVWSESINNCSVIVGNPDTEVNMQVVFPFVTTTNLGNEIGQGYNRTVFQCDYIQDGRRYVVKKARSSTGRMNNRFERMIYKWASKTKIMLEHLPEFKSVTPCGNYLLVEECMTAKEFYPHLEYGEIQDEFYEIFPPDLDNDMHQTNWGFTTENMRPVILDIGWSEFECSLVAEAVGVPQKQIKRLST